jgi:hypothetical protein
MMAAWRPTSGSDPKKQNRSCDDEGTQSILVGDATDLWSSL